MSDSPAVSMAPERAGRLFVATEPPYYAGVVVWRCGSGGKREFLILHSSEVAPDDNGDWAWGPPKGQRLPGETVDGCARRELEEETGLRPDLRPLLNTDVCGWFTAEVPAGAAVRLSDEHDRHQWVDQETAARRCRPPVIADVYRVDLTV